MAFVGALTVALIAAYYAKRRQDDALAAERERLQMQLDHDATRADIADIRAVLEELLSAEDAASTALIAAQATKETEAREEHGRAYEAAVLEMSHVINKIQIRLGDDDPITVATQE